jgi:hypothetical protein
VEGAVVDEQVGSVEKGLLREAMTGYSPDALRRRRKSTYLASGGETFGHPAAGIVYARRAASAFEGGKRFEPGAALMASYQLGAGEWVADYEVEML